VLWSACAAIRPEDVPDAQRAAAAGAVAEFPGASAILTGLDLSGEQALRDGDQVLYGVELADGERIRRHLLRIQVRRKEPGQDTGSASVLVAEGVKLPPVPTRMTRLLDLDLTLFDVDGKEVQRSSIGVAMDFVFAESFIAGIVGRRDGDAQQERLARLRLEVIAGLLTNDPVLRHLLAEAASVPWDVRLLFRREMSLKVHFDKGVQVADDGAALPLPGPRYELPFDLFLNESLLVRLSALVVDPQGPTGAAAGIVRLIAQQADAPTRRLRLELLAAARGPQPDFAAHGMIALCGFVDEGVALAFSADGHWLATPGPRGVVELRDLTRADPSVPQKLRGAAAAVGDLAFLDADTLLVGRGAQVEVFDLKSGPDAAGEHAPRCVLPFLTQPFARHVMAIEPGPARTLFVGGPGAEVQRWTFGADLAATQIETVRPATVIQGTLEDGTKLPYYDYPQLGWLVAGDDPDRVLVRWKDMKDSRWEDADAEWRRLADGTWRETELGKVENTNELSRRDRWRAPMPTLPESVAKGLPLSRPQQGGGHAWVGEVVTVTDSEGTRWLGRSHTSAGFACHGFDPTGRFFVFVGPGYRLILDRRHKE